MRELTNADLVWKRACDSMASFAWPGDQALQAMVSFHSVAMNGGVQHSIEHFGIEELPTIASAYRLFGIDKVADLLLEAEQFSMDGNSLSLMEDTLDRRYGKAVHNDAALVERFETYFRDNPSAFAPL